MHVQWLMVWSAPLAAQWLCSALLLPLHSTSTASAAVSLQMANTYSARAAQVQHAEQPHSGKPACGVQAPAAASALQTSLTEPGLSRKLLITQDSSRPASRVHAPAAASALQAWPEKSPPDRSCTMAMQSEACAALIIPAHQSSQQRSRCSSICLGAGQAHALSNRQQQQRQRATPCAMTCCV